MTLSVESRAKVASAVTGRQHYWINQIGMTGLFDLPEDELMMCKGILIPDHLWAPGFEGSWTSNRDQALALVQFFFDWLKNNHYAGYMTMAAPMIRDFIDAMMDKDIAALEYMAHQMITKGKEDE